MLPIPQQYIGSTCEVKSMENEFLSSGRLIKIDHDALEISAGAAGFMQILKYRLPVKLFIHNAKLEEKILVGLTYLSTDNFLRVEDVRPLAEFERRGAFRVNSGVVGKLSPIMTEEERKAFDKKVEALPGPLADQLLDETFFDVRVADISLTGVRLISPKPLTEGDRYYIEFTPIRDTLVFFLQVQRIIHMPDGSINYGCNFFDVPERQMDLLCRDLFQLQRLEMNRRRNSAAHVAE